MPNAMNQGVRRLHNLGWLGSAFDTEQGMISEGYSQGDLDTLIALGATDAQLQQIWNSYAPETPEYADAVASLLAQLTGGVPLQQATKSPSYPVRALPAPPMTGTQFQQALNLPGGTTGIANVPGPGVPPPILPPAPPPPPPLTFEQWVTKNGSWIIGIFAAVIILPPLIKKL
jgi:hypothetical protein